MKSILLIKMHLGLVEITFVLVYASLSLPECKLKNDFLCTLEVLVVVYKRAFNKGMEWEKVWCFQGSKLKNSSGRLLVTDWRNIVARFEFFSYQFV